MVPGAKVNCRPWVTVHFAQGTTVIKLECYVMIPESLKSNIITLPEYHLKGNAAESLFNWRFNSVAPLREGGLQRNKRVVVGTWGRWCMTIKGL